MLLDISSLPKGRQLKVRRTALALSQAEVARLVGTYPERVCEAETESRYRSPQAVAALQEQIDAALSQLEREKGLVTDARD